MRGFQELQCFLQSEARRPNFYDKAAGLRKWNTEPGDSNVLLLVGVVVLLALFGIGYWYNLRSRYRGPERRGAGPTPPADLPVADAVQDVAKAPDAPALARFAGTPGVRLVVTIAAKRKAVELTSTVAAGAALLAHGLALSKLDDTMARIVVRSDDGNYLIYDVTIRPGTQKDVMVIEPTAGTTPIRVRPAVRIPVTLASKGQVASRPCGIRIIDVSLGGFGLFVDDKAVEGDTITLRVQLPGFADAIAVDGRAQWTKEGSGGQTRVGLMATSMTGDESASIADYIVTSRKALTSKT